MTDILDRLNAIVDRQSLKPGDSLVADAADEIKRLRAALAQIKNSAEVDGYHTRQAKVLQGIAADALDGELLGW